MYFVGFRKSLSISDHSRFLTLGTPDVCTDMSCSLPRVERQLSPCFQQQLSPKCLTQQPQGHSIRLSFSGGIKCADSHIAGS